MQKMNLKRLKCDYLVNPARRLWKQSKRATMKRSKIIETGKGQIWKKFLCIRWGKCINGKARSCCSQKHTPKSQWLNTAKVSTLFTLSVYRKLMWDGILLHRITQGPNGWTVYNLVATPSQRECFLGRYRKGKNIQTLSLAWIVHSKWGKITNQGWLPRVTRWMIVSWTGSVSVPEEGQSVWEMRWWTFWVLCEEFSSEDDRQIVGNLKSKSQRRIISWK